MRLTRRSFTAIALVLLVAIAGCSGGAGGGDGGAQRAEDSGLVAGAGGGATAVAEATMTPAEEADKAVEEDADSAEFQSRSRIRTGRVELEVDDFEAARQNLTRAAERHGGFVSDASERLHRIDNESYTTGVLVLRVPKDNFTALLERVKAEGTVLRVDQNSKDVTDQLVDINARLDNLRAQRDQLRELYDRANDTEEVLEVQERLSDVQGEIERLEARKQALERRVALSTITVELREPRPDPDRIGPDEWYETGVLAAFLESVNGVVVALRAIVVAFAYALPYLVVFGVPIVGAGVVVWRRRSSGPEDSDTTEEVSEDEPSDEE